MAIWNWLLGFRISLLTVGSLSSLEFSRNRVFLDENIYSFEYNILFAGNVYSSPQRIEIAIWQGKDVHAR